MTDYTDLIRRLLVSAAPLVDPDYQAVRGVLVKPNAGAERGA